MTQRIGRPPELSNEAILAVARRVFLEQGCGVSAQLVARELGISHTTLFNRFGSKEGLLLAALGPPPKITWLEWLEKTPTDPQDTRERFGELCWAIADYFAHIGAGLAALHAAGIHSEKIFHNCSEARPQSARHALRTWIEREQGNGGLARCDSEALAWAMLGMLRGVADSHAEGSALPEPGEFRARVARVAEILWQGLAPR